MTPGPGEYLSYLMGAPTITNEELRGLRVAVVGTTGWGHRKLLIPGGSLQAYRELVRERLDPGFWNEVVSREEILFTFKPMDGTVHEFRYSAENRQEIAALCTALNGDPIDTTSDIPSYLASNEFYRELMVEAYGVKA